MDAITIYLPGILLSYGAFLLGVMTPGPNILAIIGTSMSTGRKPGMALAMGVATGSVLWGTLTMAGLSALLSVYADILLVIKIAGGLFLLWLSYKAFKAAAAKHDLHAQALQGEGWHWRRYYLRGLLVQMTNPKAAMSWIAIMSLGLQADAPLWVAVVTVAGIGLLSVSGHLLYALAFSTGTMVRLYSRARRGIQAALGTFFALAGIKLLASRI